MARFELLRKIHWDFSAGFPFWIRPCRDIATAHTQERWASFDQTNEDLASIHNFFAV